MGVPWNKRFLVLFFFIVIGLFRGSVWRPFIPQGYFDHPHNVCGTVGNPTARVLEELTIDQKKVWGRLSLFLKNRTKISVGQRICFQGAIQRIKNFGTRGEFDFERHTGAQNIWGKVSISQKTLITVQKQVAFYPIQKQREKFSQFLNRYSSGAILKALVLGDQSQISKPLKEDFIRSGLIHLLVVSGQNVSLVLLFCLSIVQFFLVRSERLLLHFNIQKILVFVGLGIIFFFYFFSGAAIPILRASLMSVCLLIGYFYSRQGHGFYSLLWSLALILNFFPSSLLDPSFQLSFAATAGLLALTVHCPNRYFFWLLTPVLAFVTTAPLVLFHFYRISWISLVSNLLIVPYMTFLMLPFSFILTGVYFISSSCADHLMIVFDFLVRILIFGVQKFSQFPGSFSYFPSPTLFELLITYGMFCFMSCFIFKRRYGGALKSFVFGMSILGLSLGFSLILKQKNPYLRISFLSVGQGDSSLIELPCGKTILIDGGGMWGLEIGERVVAPYLWKKRIRTLDIMIMSHSDFDHIQGLEFILKHFKVREFWLSQWQTKTKTFYKVLALAEHYNIPCILLSEKNDSTPVGEVQFKFLNPSHPFLKEKVNNLSLVFKLTYKNFSVLFTGDIEKEVEESLLSYDIGSTLLKVPHHGSKTSSSAEFLKKVSPKLAVISLGIQNRYHFPHPSVLKRYEALKIPLWRTDEKGTLQIRTDGFQSSCLIPRLCLFN